MARNDLRNFSRRIHVIADNVGENTDNLVRKVALAVDQTVVMATPVDTGRARSNWQVGLNHVPNTTREAYVEGTEGATGGANSQAAIKHAQEEIAKYKQGQEINITNNLPYIGRLNDGYSAQAPAGFVQIAIRAGLRTIRSINLIDPPRE